MRGEPAQPKSEPVPETNAASGYSNEYNLRVVALQAAMSLQRPSPSAEQLIKDAAAIELYLKGEIE